jgi:hypothetical protein
MGISMYSLGVVGALTVASCLALSIGLALNRRGVHRKHFAHTPGGRVIPPTASSGLWSGPYARVGSGNPARPAGRQAHQPRPLTADQQATREAWARWRAEQGR